MFIPPKTIINLERISQAKLETEPYRWAVVDRLFSPPDAAALSASFPHDHFKRLSHYGGDKDSEYEARALIDFRADSIARPGRLSQAWRELANNFLSSGYRRAISSLTGCDLTHALLEVNVFHYPPGGVLGPHPDLPDKIVTHVLFFNRVWNDEDGGCLTILRSANPQDVRETISPVVGRSAVLVRSENSWHAVSPVLKSCRHSRRSLTATFYHPGSVSTMWPPGDTTPLHDYHSTGRWRRWWSRFTA
jgi:hypothetical protein